jgi:hypothetical protein
MTTLASIAQRIVASDPATKPASYYEIYEQVLQDERLEPLNILEVGVFKGQSTRVLATRFPAARIVALDVKRYEIDFSAHPNVEYLLCDQTDRKELQSICGSRFPKGIDLVIEDASHIGAFSRTTFEAVFPHLRSGGLYMIEDWGTGYWDDYFDGSRFQQYPLSPPFDGHLPKRIPSHDFGMVGFVKSLVDYVHETAIRRRQQDPPARQSRLKSLRFFEGVCVAAKA